jgi:hypothetical protein
MQLTLFYVGFKELSCCDECYLNDRLNTVFLIILMTQETSDFYDAEIYPMKCYANYEDITAAVFFLRLWWLGISNINHYVIIYLVTFHFRCVLLQIISFYRLFSYGLLEMLFSMFHWKVLSSNA